MNYTNHDKNTDIVTVKKELSLEFEKLEFEELECEDNKPEEFGNKVIELLGLQSVPTDTDASKLLEDPLKFEESCLHVKQDVDLKIDMDGSEQKISTCQNDEESSQIIIKEEIDCDIDDGTVTGLGSLPFADKVAGTTLRRSSRRRCVRYAVGDLLESSSDETSVSKHNKKVRIQSSSHCNCEKRLSTAPEGRSKSSKRCEVCGKFYKQFCDICGRWFSQLGSLRRHAATHSASKPYTCGQCGKSFSRSDTLKEHERLHSGKKYRCAECGREFLQRTQIRMHMHTHMHTHMRTHTRTHTGEQRYHCADCDKVFCNRQSLCYHVRIHMAELLCRCADCGKAFRERSALRDHVRIHTGERPFACRICGKAFRQAAHLRDHTRIHTGERRHSCDACSRRFIRKQHLYVHACSERRATRGGENCSLRGVFV